MQYIYHVYTYHTYNKEFDSYISLLPFISAFFYVQILDNKCRNRFNKSVFYVYTYRHMCTLRRII